ncbi:MAG TPA: thioredoxin family protein [Thermoanaerobaculia bacterium]|nr:thioredoxin family protein [Thermoanaerobaculia bacterium]
MPELRSHLDPQLARPRRGRSSRLARSLRAVREVLRLGTRVALSALVLWCLAPAILAQPPRAAVQKATLDVVTDRDAYPFGAIVGLAAKVTIEDGWHLQSHTPSLEYLIPTVLSVELPEGWELDPTTDIDYPPDKLWQSSFEAEPLAVYEGTILIRARLRAPPASAAGTDQVTEVSLPVQLEYQACDDRVCLQPTTADAVVPLVLGRDGAPQYQELFEAGSAPESGAATAAARRGGTTLVAAILLGVVGGLILNLMPCVLPVLSIKVFGLVREAGAARSAVTRAALAIAAGILFSFWTLAALAAGARAAGELVGWGIQFQNPGFVAFLAIVLLFFALNLWGLFEIPLPAALANRLGTTAGHSGPAGHFAAGLFATLMATPCSAPFLGTAVGFALSQPAWATFAVFTAVGLGMALPYLVLAIAPGALAILPRPGAWMDTLKKAMGFLLVGTVVWLLYVLGAQIAPERLAFVEGALLALALFAWLRGQARSGPSRALAAAGVVACAAATLLLAATAARGAAGYARGTPSLLTWTPFDESRAVELAAGGELVFIDVTADWCATCKVIERVVLETEEVAALFERHGVVAMRADWTNRDDQISQFLAGFGRYAIPFYVLYRPGQEPHVFGELLTRSAVIEVVEGAAARVAARAR